MSENKISSDWIIENKRILPWKLLLGASITTNDNKILTVVDVEIRDWTDGGPLLSVTYNDDLAQQIHDYVTKGFESGYLREVHPKKENFELIQNEAKSKRINNTKEADESKPSSQQNNEPRSRKRSDQLGSDPQRDVNSNPTCQFDLLLFDLDDTLLKSSHLESYRGKEHVGEINPGYAESLRKAAEKLECLYPQSLICRIGEVFPDLKLGVFTRAPRVYAEILLAKCYPTIEWDCIISYEDVQRTKPFPDGIFLAVKRTAVSNIQRVALVGDGKTDIIAAYQAGCYAILSRLGWGADWNEKNNPQRSEHYQTLELLPDAIVQRPSDIAKIITEPWEFLLALESWDATWVNKRKKQALRVDELNHFSDIEKTKGGGNRVSVKVLGRYFPPHKPEYKFDFNPKSRTHQVSTKILTAKNGNEYPDPWVRCVAWCILEISEKVKYQERRMIICPVPARPGRAPRLELLLEQVMAYVSESEYDIQFDGKVLCFKEGVQANKNLNKQERFVNIKSHLYVANQQAVSGNNVIVIDDITTSGASFFYAEQYLKKAKAKNVHCIALAQTVS